MRIGYSFWGFLGRGITDTPDSGRSHRRVLVDALTGDGHEMVFLQPDRDSIEAGEVLGGGYRWDAGLPDLDALFLEWRWPVVGRNTTWCGAAGHACDLHRQDQLLDHYLHARSTPTIIWDTHRRLAASHALRIHPAVTVCEPALHPSPGALSLLFPVADAALDAADTTSLARLARPTALAYVGNQTDLDRFAAFFAPAAAEFPHLVAGGWPDAALWPGLNFTGSVPFCQVEEIHRSALATMVLLPRRHERAGHMTQRLFEAALAGCLPLMPASVRSVETICPHELIIADADGVAAVVRKLVDIAGTAEHARLLEAWLAKLGVFRLSVQLKMINTVLAAQSPFEVRQADA